MMRTSQEWWTETKSDPRKLISWLQKQYYGELLAADRIKEFAISRAPEKFRLTLNTIAGQERKHASWIGQLLAARNDVPKLRNESPRYWDETLKGIHSFESATAVAAHAERMRLERIRVIAGDAAAPEDIREVFQKILVEEEFHERAFIEMTTPGDLIVARSNHDKGMKSIGLINTSEVL